MKRKAIIAAILFALGLTSTTFAQTLTPKAVIQSIRQAYGKVQSLKATVQVKLGSEAVVSTVQFRRPKQFVVETTQNGQPMETIYSDGKTLTVYRPQAKTYQQREIEADSILIGDLTLVGFTAVALEPRFGEVLEQYFGQNFTKAQAKGSSKVGSVPCRTVELSGKGGTMTLYLGSKDGLVYRMVYKMAEGETYEETVTNLQVNPTIPQNVFAFKPPVGAKKAEPKTQEAQSEGTDTLKGQDAPDFSLPDLEGNTVSLRDLKGKVVYLDFWATWCPPCRESLPHTQALSQHEKAKTGDLVVLAVNAREEADKVKQYLQSNGYSFRVVLDKDGEVLNRYKVQGIPTFVLINRDGKVVWVQVGFARGMEKQLEEAVAKALAQ